MKKCLFIIFIHLLILTFVGCEKDIDNNKGNTSLETVTTKQAEADQQVKESEIIEILSAEDKAVKLEIAKHSDTKVDFRNQKQETIQNKTYDAFFEGVKELHGKKELVTYKNDAGDEFLYKANTGKLFLARINSNPANETVNKIDIDTAQKTAEKYVADNCDISALELSMKTKISNGYFFEYSKYISNYKTNATFEIKIGFNGQIIYIRDNTNALDGINLNIDENWINEKKNECLSNSKDDSTEIKRVYISAEGESVNLIIALSNGAEFVFKIGKTGDGSLS